MVLKYFGDIFIKDSFIGNLRHSQESSNVNDSGAVLK